MSGLTAQGQRSSPYTVTETNEKALPLTQEVYESSLKDDVWDFNQTKQLLEAVQSLGASWNEISKMVNQEPSECSKRYCQVVEVLFPKEKRRKLNDVGQSDPGTPSKKRRRRTAAEIERAFKCDAPDCNKAYGSEGALKMHIKLKHPGISIVTSPPSPTNSVRPSSAKSSDVPTPTPLHASAPSVLTSQPVASDQVRATAGPRLATNDRFSDIPVLVMSIGSWQKRSMFCGDTMARFSYEERKFVWEIYHFNSLFARMEIPFDSVTSIEYEPFQDSIVKLSVEISAPPTFFEGVIQAHKPTTWRAINSDFTGGEASTTRKHTLHLLKLSVAQPLEHLLKVEPRFQQIFKANISPPKDNPPPPSLRMPSSTNSATFASAPTDMAPSSVNIAPSYSNMAPSLVASSDSVDSFADAVLADMGHSANGVPPLVSEDSSSSSSESFASYTSSDDEDEHRASSPEGLRKCQCVGSCSGPACMCFKSLESCGNDCGCYDCSNPLNEELHLTSSSPSSPESLMFFPSTYLTPLSPPNFSTPLLPTGCSEEVLSLLSSSLEFPCPPQLNTIW